MLRREVARPSRMLVEPLVDIGRVVRREIVHDDVTSAGGVDRVDDVEQLDERIAIVVARGEAEGLAAAHVERAHPAELAVSLVLELAADGLTGRHRNIGVATLERLHSGLLIDAYDVLVARSLVVDAENVVAFGPEFVVLRREPHLLAMRLQVRVLEDARDAGVTQGQALSAQVLAEKAG